MEDKKLSKRVETLENNLKGILGIIVIIFVCLFLLIALLEAKGVC